MKIEKVDAHHHFWWAASPHYPMMQAPDTERYIGNTGRLKFDFPPETFKTLAAAQNVTRSVYIESHYAPAIEETAFVQAIAERTGFPHAIIARADLAAPDLPAQLDVHQASPLFRGLRAMVNWDADPRLTAAADGLLDDPAWRAGYAELGRRGLVIELIALPAQLAALAALAAACPETRLVVGHCGMPFRRTAAEHDAWAAGIAALAALPHVTMKISGLGLCDHDWTVASIEPLVLEIIARFGPDRCMFASNFPVDRLYSSYDAIWDAFDAITADFSAAARQALFRDTAMRVFAIA